MPCAAEKAGEELGLAAIQGHVEVARFLLAAGADMNLGPESHEEFKFVAIVS